MRTTILHLADSLWFPFPKPPFSLFRPIEQQLILRRIQQDPFPFLLVTRVFGGHANLLQTRGRGGIGQSGPIATFAVARDLGQIVRRGHGHGGQGFGQRVEGVAAKQLQGTADKDGGGIVDSSGPPELLLHQGRLVIIGVARVVVFGPSIPFLVLDKVANVGGEYIRIPIHFCEPVVVLGVGVLLMNPYHAPPNLFPNMATFPRLDLLPLLLFRTIVPGAFHVGDDHDVFGQTLGIVVTVSQIHVTAIVRFNEGINQKDELVAARSPRVEDFEAFGARRRCPNVGEHAIETKLIVLLVLVVVVSCSGRFGLGVG